MARTTLPEVTKLTRENEVLKYKLEIDAKNYEDEKNKIAAEDNKTIESLKDENDSLRETVDEKEDKINELKTVIGVISSQLKSKDNAVQTLKVQEEENKELLCKRGDQIKTLHTELDEMGLELEKKKEEIQNLVAQQKELSDQISKLEQENKKMHRESSTRQKQMRDEITRLNNELREVKQSLQSKDKDVKKLLKSFDQFAATQDKVNMECKIREQEREKRDNQIQRSLEEVLKQLNSPKTKIAILDAQNVQVGHACTNQQNSMTVKSVAVNDIIFSKPGCQNKNQRTKRPR